jgi:hypothetical protein
VTLAPGHPSHFLSLMLESTRSVAFKESETSNVEMDSRLSIGRFSLGLF